MADKTEYFRQSMNPGTTKDKHHWENWVSANDLTAMDNTEKKNQSTASSHPSHSP